MGSLWDNVKKGVTEFYESAAERTDELARVSVRKLDIVGIKRNIGHEMADLGGRVYHMVVEEAATDIAGDADVKTHIESIRRLEAFLKEKEAEIGEIQKLAREKREGKGPS
ncbi:MAG: hypothetical protein V2A71_06365 [Candidatus Eisenbacteria bacterium]